MALFDFCLNLTSSQFKDDQELVLERAKHAGVSHCLIAGSDLADSQHAVELCSQHSHNLYATVGVHPHNAKGWQDNTRAGLQALAQCNEVLAIGEAGLDFHRNLSTQEQQEHAFRQQIELSIELGLPLFLHERDAHDRFREIISEYHSALQATVVHCFTGDRIALECYIEMGFYIGITGWICDERRGKHLHELVSLIPQDRLLIETDAPYLLPRSLRPKPKNPRNEPCHLPHISEHIARHRGDDKLELCRYSMENALRFLRLTQTEQAAVPEES
ncbi:MAG: TatD family hydrolase [Gammaproteobacteria bacterium]|jgi:TatD DNase family protein|nr:TatD family hydrolase [Gammaproteobacteria bacterium]